MHVDLSFHDETILEHFADVLARVGKGNLSDLVGIDPNSLLSALEHGGREPLLELQGRHIYYLLLLMTKFLFISK